MQLKVLPIRLHSIEFICFPLADLLFPCWIKVPLLNPPTFSFFFSVYSKNDSQAVNSPIEFVLFFFCSGLYSSSVLCFVFLSAIDLHSNFPSPPFRVFSKILKLAPQFFPLEMVLIALSIAEVPTSCAPESPARPPSLLS